MSKLAQAKRVARNAGFTTYPGYREAEAQWTGRVPKGWKLRKLKYAAEFTPERASEASANLPYVSLEHIESETGKLLELDEETTPDSTVHRFRSGDVLFGKLRPYLAKVWNAHREGDCTSELVVLRPREDVSPSFLHFQLLAPPFIDAVDAQTYGAKMPRVSPRQLGDMYVAVPSREEQQSIVQFLNIQTSRIDRLIDKKERLIELLEERRTALITKAVTKGLDPDVAMKDSGVEWLGEIPVHWDTAPVKYVARLETGHTPSRSNDEYWQDCEIPWFTLADVGDLRTDRVERVTETQEEISELGIRNSSARLLPEGTVMLSRTASVGFSAIMGRPMATSQDFVNWVCGKELLPEFLLYVFRAMRPELKRLVMGSTHKTIYMPDIEGLQTPLPSLTEQRRIVDEIHARSHKLLRLTDKIRAAVERLQEYRSALITAAVTGKIDVREHAA